MYDIETITIASTVNEALTLLAADEKAVVIAGGSDLLIKIREGRLAGCSLVSIHDLEALQGVSRDPTDGSICIGAATSFARVARDPIIRAHLPMLADAVEQVGGPQLRAVGTLGGNVCNGVTSADSPPTLLCMNTRLRLRSLSGQREVLLTDFYKGPGRVDLRPGELLTDLVIDRRDYEGFGGHYIKYAQRSAMDIATLGCAAYLRLSADRKTVGELRLAFGVAAPTPIRAPHAEAAAAGHPVDSALPDLLAEAALL
ncbi:MAG: xanthine dehydrogenase FAD-binding subunit XdhB, partial [Oscillospiraceae bacterium]